MFIKSEACVYMIRLRNSVTGTFKNYSYEIKACDVIITGSKETFEIYCQSYGNQSVDSSFKTDPSFHIVTILTGRPRVKILFVIVQEAIIENSLLNNHRKV